MVSVIIPVYKVEDYLCECVDSVINQTYKDLEIILVDDGSPDRCPTLCDEYALKDSRVKVIHKENGGQSSARNAGIDIAAGEYFVFIDSDDVISPTMIEQLLFATEQYNADMSVCEMTRASDGLDIGINRNAEIYASHQVLKYILTEKKITTSPGAKLYKRELFEGVRYQEGKIYEDFGTTYKLVDKSRKIAFVNTHQYYYRCNAESTTQAAFSNKHLDYYFIAKEMQEFIELKYPKYKQLLVNHGVRISISFMRKISICGFDDAETVAFLTKHIRTGIVRYMFSGYSVFSKLYGLIICVSPKLALKIFYRR